MKKIIALASVALFSFAGLTTVSNAQSKVGTAVKDAGHGIGKAADAVGKKSAELSVKGYSKVVDKKYDGYVAPDGSDVYLTGKDKKYYINKKGKRIYLKPSQIKKAPVKK